MEQHGSSMGAAWEQRGSSMGAAWEQRGSNMGAEREQTGSQEDIIGISLEYQGDTRSGSHSESCI